jgi:hypothetical protein
MRRFHWSLDEVRMMTTPKIVAKLRHFGVDFNEEQFLKEVKRSYSAEDIAKAWREQYLITAQGLDDDFIWIASVVLWERLAPPDVLSSEQLDDMMQQGYYFLEDQEPAAACIQWLELWEFLKPRFTKDITDVAATDSVFLGLQSIYN